MNDSFGIGTYKSAHGYFSFGTLVDILIARLVGLLGQVQFQLLSSEVRSKVTYLT